MGIIVVLPPLPSSLVSLSLFWVCYQGVRKLKNPECTLNPIEIDTEEGAVISVAALLSIADHVLMTMDEAVCQQRIWSVLLEETTSDTDSHIGQNEKPLIPVRLDQAPWFSAKTTFVSLYYWVSTGEPAPDAPLFPGPPYSPEKQDSIKLPLDLDRLPVDLPPTLWVAFNCSLHFSEP